MFTSLRTRLWLSYGLLIIVALTVVGGLLFSFLISNPLIYRQATRQINQVEKALLNRQDEWAQLPPARLQRWMERAVQAPLAQEVDVRILVFNPQRDLISDSQPGAPAVALPNMPRIRKSGIVRDASGSSWLYSVTQLDNRNWLLVAALRPDVPLASILRDEFFTPILRAGIVALLFSLVLAFVVARWIADPLQRLVTASKKVPDVQVTDLPENGPREVQDLVFAYKEMLARLQLGQKSQRDFVANVSHEMKTPLTSIQGFAQAILDGTAATEAERQQAAEIIYNEAGRMHRMVMGLLELARLEAGTANLQVEPVDLAALLHTVREKFTPQARQLNVNLVVEAAEIPTIPGDGDRLVQVLINLVDNALRHTPPGGQATLSARAEPGGVRVMVNDTGEGIPTEALLHIFDRFYRADPARQGGKDQGAGLGLAIAREIILAHQGTLKAESQPGKGSCFTIHLPETRPEASTLIRRKPQ